MPDLHNATHLVLSVSDVYISVWANMTLYITIAMSALFHTSKMLCSYVHDITVITVQADICANPIKHDISHTSIAFTLTMMSNPYR